jgi:hypothetical protein
MAVRNGTAVQLPKNYPTMFQPQLHCGGAERRHIGSATAFEHPDGRSSHSCTVTARALHLRGMAFPVIMVKAEVC